MWGGQAGGSLSRLAPEAEGPYICWEPPPGFSSPIRTCSLQGRSTPIPEAKS